MEEAFRREIDDNGFAIAKGVVDVERCQRLIAALNVPTHAIRNLLELVPEVAEIARTAAVRSFARAILGTDCFAVRGIFFDKTAESNWKVAWHQDLTIAVRERIEVEGFGPWSVKAGLPHVQPPPDLLARMLTLRIHLDDCGAENGPVRVVSGSHRLGKMSAEEIARRSSEREMRTILADRGDLLAMRPLLLHASSAALSPGHRRVVHLEFAAEDLPGGLEWHGRW